MGKSAPNPPYVSSTESTDSMMQAYIKNLPALMQATGQSILPYEQAQLNAKTQLMPQYTEAQLDLMRNYGSQFADVNSQLEADYANRQAQTYTDLFKGIGLEEAKAAQAMQEAVDPEYYASRKLASARLADLLNNPYSGSDKAEVERASNRGFTSSGLDGTPTSSGAISSALQFGSAGKSALSNALAQASQVMPSLRSGIDVFQQITGRPSSTNTQGMLGYTQPNVGQTTTSLGDSLLGNLTSTINSGNQANAGMYGNWVSKYQSAKDNITGYYNTFGPQQFSGII